MIKQIYCLFCRKKLLYYDYKNIDFYSIGTEFICKNCLTKTKGINIEEEIFLQVIHPRYIDKQKLINADFYYFSLNDQDYPKDYTLKKIIIDTRKPFNNYLFNEKTRFCLSKNLHNMKIFPQKDYFILNYYSNKKLKKIYKEIKYTLLSLYRFHFKNPYKSFIVLPKNIIKKIFRIFLD